MDGSPCQMSHLIRLARSLCRKFRPSSLRGWGQLGFRIRVGAVPLIWRGYNPAGDPAGALAIRSEMQVRDQRLAAYPFIHLRATRRPSGKTRTTNSGGGFVYTTAVEHFAIAYQHYVLLVWGLVCQTPYQSTETPWRYTRSHRHTKGLWCCAWYTRRHVESGIHAEAFLDGIPGQCVCTCTSCRGFGAFMHVFRIEHTHTHTQHATEVSESDHFGGQQVSQETTRLQHCAPLRCPDYWHADSSNIMDLTGVNTMPCCIGSTACEAGEKRNADAWDC